MSGTYVKWPPEGSGSGGGSGGAPLTVGAIDSAAASSNGAVIGSSTLYMQSASLTNPGLVNNTTQVFSGTKTFPTIVSTTVTTGSVSQTSTPGGARYTVNWPSAQGAGSTFLQNDGSGNLTWSLASGSGAGGVSIVMGTFDSIAPTANGATIGSGFLFLQSSTATMPGLVSSASQTIAGIKTFSNQPIFSSLTASSPVRSDGSKGLISGSISLTIDVTGNLPLAQTSGSISLINQVSGSLPLSQTSGSISLVNQVSGSLPIAQTSGSVSLTTQVSGVLPAANTSALSALSGAINLSTQTTSSISLTTQVSGVLPLANGGFTNPMSGPSDLIIGSASGTLARLGTNGLPGQSIVTGSSTGASLNWISDRTIKNVSFTTVASVDANALSITFRTASGATFTPASPGIIPIDTASGGTYRPLVLDTFQNITIPGAATLGLVSSFSQYVWVYALATGSALDFGVSASVFNEGDSVTTVQISATSSNSSVLYSRDGIGAGARLRNLGRVSTLYSGTTWTVAAVAPLADPIYAATEWTVCTMSISAVTTPPVLGAAFFQQAQFRRDGGDMLYRWQYLSNGSGSVSNGTGTYLPQLPTDRAYRIDTRFMVVSTVSCTPVVGIGKFGANAAGADIPCVAGVAGSTSLVFFKTDGIGVATWTSGDATITTAFKGSFDVRIPIWGWSAFGPLF